MKKIILVFLLSLTTLSGNATTFATDNLTANTASIVTPLPKASGGTGNATGTATVNANLTGPITSVGNATSVAAQTGTGSTFVMQTSPALTTPNLGTPTTLVGTNITGTASALSIGGNAATATTSTNQSGGTVSATTITATTGAITPHYPGGVVGNATGSAVTAGSVGETITSTASGVSLTNATATAVTSISLTAGTWIIFGNSVFTYSGGAATSGLAIAINSIPTIPSSPLYSFLQFASGVQQGIVAPTITVNTNATAAYYLVVQANFVGGSMTGDAIITAVRVG